MEYQRQFNFLPENVSRIEDEFKVVRRLLDGLSVHGRWFLQSTGFPQELGYNQNYFTQNGVDLIPFYNNLYLAVCVRITNILATITVKKDRRKNVE